MYIKIPTWKNPFSTTPLTDAIGFLGITNFDHVSGVGYLALAIYPDKESADRGSIPVDLRHYMIPAAGTTSLDGGFALPSLKQIESDNAQLFEALVGVFYTLLLADPALAGATPLPPGAN